MKKLLLVILLCLPAIIAAVTPERQRKADYYFMESLRRDAAEEFDAGYLLLQRAVELDGLSSSEPGSILGGKMISLSRGDSAMLNAGMALLEKHFNSNPSDLYAGFNLAITYEHIGQGEQTLRIWQRLDSIYPDDVNVIWRRAAVEGRYGSPDTALILLDRIERLEGINPQLVMQQTQLLLTKSDTAAAMNRVEKLLDAMPADADTRVYAAGFYDHIGRRDLAAEAIEKALELDPSNGAAYYQRANLYKVNGESDKYLKEIVTAIRLDDLDQESKLGLLADYLKQYGDSADRRDETNAIMQSLVGQYPHDETMRRYISGYYLAIKDYAQAAEQLAYAADMNHDDPELWAMVIRLYSSADSLDRSIATAREAVGYMPDDAELRQLLGMVLSQSGRYAEAIETFKESLMLDDEADPEAASETYTSLGDVWQQACEPDSAIAAYEKALELFPDNDLALNNYAYYLATRNQELTRAEKMSSRSMLLRPGLATYLDTYAWILYQLGDYQKAKEYIDTALLRTDKSQLSSELLEHAGDINFRLGRKEAAIEYWRDALELEPDNERLQQKVNTEKL